MEAQAAALHKHAKSGRYKTKIMDLSVRNLSDIHGIRRDSFMKKIMKFNLDQCVDEIEQLMKNSDWSSRSKHQLSRSFESGIELLGDAQRIE